MKRRVSVHLYKQKFLLRQKHKRIILWNVRNFSSDLHERNNVKRKQKVRSPHNCEVTLLFVFRYPIVHGISHIHVFSGRYILQTAINANETMKGKFFLKFEMNAFFVG